MLLVHKFIFSIEAEIWVRLSRIDVLLEVDTIEARVWVFFNFELRVINCAQSVFCYRVTNFKLKLGRNPRQVRLHLYDFEVRVLQSCKVVLG